MYSGEVNVYEGQIPSLISLAETLGVKGLADFQTNTCSKLGSEMDEQHDEAGKSLSKSGANLLMQSLQFYPNFLTQPLNFSQEALNQTPEIISNDHRCNIQQEPIKPSEAKAMKAKINKNNYHSTSVKPADLKNLEEIVENLNTTTYKTNMDVCDPSYLTNTSLCPTGRYPNKSSLINEECKVFEFEDHSALCIPPPECIQTHLKHFEKTLSTNSIGKTASTKLYATCFICQKQLSNQYNLRVHMETHQNVRYACNVCSHVSRSKDALRKHVSYRHPGTPSACETEAKRKRSRPLSSPFTLLREGLNCMQNSNSKRKSPSQQPLLTPGNEGAPASKHNETNELGIESSSPSMNDST